MFAAAALSLLLALPIHLGPETTIAEKAPASYAFAAGGENPVLAWVAPAFGGMTVFVAPLDRLDTPVELPLRTVGATVVQPAIVFDGNGYLVTWVETSGAVQSAVALRLDRELRPRTFMPVALTFASTRTPVARPRIVRADGAWAIAWNNFLFRDDGQQLPYDYAAGNAPLFMTANDRRVLVLQSLTQPARCGFLGAVFCTPAQVSLDGRVFHGGVFLIPIQIAVRQNAPWPEVVAAPGRDGFVVAWRDSAIEAMQVGNDAAVGPRLLLGDGRDAADLIAAGDGSLFVVAWSEVTGLQPRGLMLRAITSRGVSDPIVLGRDLTSAQIVPLGGERMLLLYRRDTKLMARLIAEQARVRVAR